ncbi:MAG: hypothetical protein IPK82_35185 [Polyangiaceae bacterium]|nr:hypothetical protein [Polyangiaceae bacterium]
MKGEKVYTNQPVKDEDNAHPVAEVWRPTLRQIVGALCRGDYEVSEGIEDVAPVAQDVAHQMRASVADYGEQLVDLPEETWKTSVCQWMGTRWEVLVDLWTVESGRSDLVLFVNVSECKTGFRFEVYSLYVP